jgi:hypothetical protein
MLYNDHFQNFKVYQIPKAQLDMFIERPEISLIEMIEK